MENARQVHMERLLLTFPISHWTHPGHWTLDRLYHDINVTAYSDLPHFKLGDAGGGVAYCALRH